jgi:serine/threonine protein kinase
VERPPRKEEGWVGRGSDREERDHLNPRNIFTIPSSRPTASSRRTDVRLRSSNVDPRLEASHTGALCLHAPHPFSPPPPGILKLGDFGLGQHLHWYQNHSKGFVGTPYYMSPQMLQGQDYTNRVRHCFFVVQVSSELGSTIWLFWNPVLTHLCLQVFPVS